MSNPNVTKAGDGTITVGKSPAEKTDEEITTHGKNADEAISQANPEVMSPQNRAVFELLQEIRARQKRIEAELGIEE